MSKESVYFKISNLNGKHGVKEIKKELDRLPGVISVSVNTENSRIAVDFDSTGTTQSHIERDLSKLGYQISFESSEKHIM